MIEIFPGVLEDSFSKIEEKIRMVEPYADWLHFDVADNTLTESVSFHDSQPFKTLKTKLNLEIHLMFLDPSAVVQAWVDVGFKRLIAHVESRDPQEFIDQAKALGVEVGLVLDGPTEVEKIKPFLSQINQITIMMIKAGKSGQKFMEENLDKIRFVHQKWPKLPIEVDGGINPQTAKLAKDAGATRFISTSFLFWHNNGRIKEAIEELKNA